MRKFIFALSAAVCMLCAGCGGLGGTMTADFSLGSSEDFILSEGRPDAGTYGCDWEKSAVSFGEEGMAVTLSRAGDVFTSGACRSRRSYGYGAYTVLMKPVKNPGVWTVFANGTDLREKDSRDEIRLEFPGSDTTKIRFHCISNGEIVCDALYDLGFDASEKAHSYGFIWMLEGVAWQVDGETVHTITENLPVTPGRMMMSLWNSTDSEDGSGAYDGAAPLTAFFRSVRYIEP